MKQKNCMEGVFHKMRTSKSVEMKGLMKSKSDTKMSCAIALTTKEEIYITADRKIEDDNCSSDDYYQRIAVISGTNIAVATTGCHPINGTKIEKMIKEVESNNFYDIARDLDSWIRYSIKSMDYSEDWHIHFDIFQCVRVYNVIQNNVCRLSSSNAGTSIDIQYNVDPFQFFSQGTAWSTGLVSGILYDDISKEKPDAYLRNIMKSVTVFSEMFTKKNPIEEGMLLLRLTPERYVWICN